MGWMPDQKKIDATDDEEINKDLQAMKDAKTDDEHDSAVDKIKRKYG